MTWLDAATIGLSTLAGLRFASARIHRYSPRRSRTGWAWMLLLTAVALRFGLEPVSVLRNTTLALRDLAGGLVLGGLWLWLKSKPSRAWLVWGLLATLPWYGVRFLRTQGATTELLLELGPDDSIDEVAATLDWNGATWEDAFPTVSMEEDEDLAQYFLLRCPEDLADSLIEALADDAEDVDSIERNSRVSLGPDPASRAPTVGEASSAANDPRLAEQWALHAIRGDAALARLAKLRPKRRAIVAIGDTGVDGGHEDLAAVFGDSPGNRDGHGHGTHCAGLAGAVTNNGIGIASLNLDGRFITILGFPALGAGGGGSAETVAQSIIDAADAGADVISLSLGGYHPTPPKVEVDAIEYALRRGAIVVVAAGNESDDASQHAPANVPGVITVAAVDQQGRKASFSNTVDKLRQPIAAPGVDMLSLGPGNAYVPMSGTSMATPLVAGLLGVMRSLDPGLTAEAAYDILRETGRRTPDEAQVGRIVDAEAALARLSR